MTQPIPQGYKQTEIGVIPEDWEVSSLESVCKEIGDGIHSTPVYSLTGKFFFINGNNIDNGKITVDENTQKVDESEFLKHGKKLSDSSILLSINGTIGNLAFFENEQLVLGKSAAYLTVKDKFSKYFIYYSLQTKSTKRMFEDGLTGSTIKNLGLSTIRQTIIPIPKREEQTAIATALSDVDALISGLESLIAKKQAIKTATMQKLLTGKTRLPQFAHHPDGTAKGYKQTELGLIPEDWGVRNLGDLLEYEQPTKYLVSHAKFLNEGSYPVLTAGKSFVLGYTNETNGIFTDLPVIIFDDFTTDSKFVNFPFKAKSSAMKMLKPRNKKTPLSLIYNLLNSVDYLVGDHKRHWIGEFQFLNVAMPSDYEEQTAIATILSDMDEEIQALETRLNKTKQIKQGMMQVLLTGKVRLV